MTPGSSAGSMLRGLLLISFLPSTRLAEPGGGSTRWSAAEPGSQKRGSRGGCEGDFVAEGFESGDEPLGFLRRVGAGGVEVGAEVGIGLAGGQHVPDDHDQGAGDGD